MLNIRRVKHEIIRPVIKYLGVYSVEAELLILETGLQESLLNHIWQVGGGPGLGLYQMEPATHQDIWNNYLKYKPEIAETIETLLAYHPSRVDQLVSNFFYSTAMCRMHYLRQPGAIPKTVEGRAAYWKKYYNTPRGKGTEKQYIKKVNTYL